MPTLYNCRHDGDQYRITKFDSDLNPESSYLCTSTECECPAGVRPTCRHREMLPLFITHEHVGDGWMYDYDRDGWVNMAYLFQPPPGVAVLTLDDPKQVHDTIADAVGEPRRFNRRGL